MHVRPILLANLLVLAAVPAAAQEQTGTLQGRVTDASGGALPGLAVTLSGPAILEGRRRW